MVRDTVAHYRILEKLGGGEDGVWSTRLGHPARPL